MQKEKGSVVAFDPSIVVTGYGVLLDGRLVEWGDIKVVTGDLSARLGYLSEKVEEIIQRHRPTLAAVEQPPAFSYARSTNKWTGKGLNAKDIIKCSFAMAVIVGALGRYGIPEVDYFDAHQWKLRAGRNMGKDEMVVMTRGLYPELREVKLSHHAAEAIYMAALARRSTNLTRLIREKR